MPIHGVSTPTTDQHKAPRVKESSKPLRASHVGTGTGIDLPPVAPERPRGREFRHPLLHAEVEASETTALGGLALAARLMAVLKVPQAIDGALSLLRSHRPYQESDHVLTHAYNLFVGGTAIEDIADLQQSDPVKQMLGASRIPDPTTAGDFLRRFDADALNSLDGAIDEVQERVWKRCHGKRKRKLGVVDLDSHVRHIYGNQKEGADFTYKGGFGYHPLVISMAETQECLRLVNRPGNTPSADGAAEHIEELVPLLTSRFKNVLIRGDSAFSRQDIFDVCDGNGLYFAMVSTCQKNFEDLADSIPERQWMAFRASDRKQVKPSKRRKRGKHRRSQKARQRGKRDLKLEKQWLAEISYAPARSDKPYRLIVRRQRIEESVQGELFELWRYRYVLTNLPKSTSTEEAVRQTYQRCDQENVIEQLQSGVAAMRMPTGSLLANHAFLVCARLAHNMKAWLAMLALPEEVMRWEWKRFRQAFVYVAARVVKKARQQIVRYSESHRFAGTISAGINRLQT